MVSPFYSTTQLDPDGLHDGELSESNEELLPWNTLWKAVLLRQIQDLLFPGPTVKDKREHRRSVEWFSTPSEDFDLVCHWAGYEPTMVRRKMIIMHSHGSDTLPDNIFYITKKRRGGTLRHIRSLDGLFAALVSSQEQPLQRHPPS